MFKPILEKISHVSKKDKLIANQQEMLNSFNIKINRKLKEFNSSSETTRIISFNQWLAGLMDSDGSFSLSKKNYLTCEITLGPRELGSLYKIKTEFGGSIKLRAKAKAFRWRLHKKSLLLKFLNSLNGFIYLKLDQYNKVMNLYLPGALVRSESFSFYSAWLSGFFEGEGFININSTTYQITLSISQKNKSILEKIKSTYGGHIYFDLS